MSSIRSVEEIFCEAYPKLCSYSDAKKNPKYTSQVRWAERTYMEQFDEEENPSSPSYDGSMILDHICSIETVMKNILQKTETLEAALEEHKKEVNAVQALFLELQHTVGGILRRIEEKKESRHIFHKD